MSIKGDITMRERRISHIIMAAAVLFTLCMGMASGQDVFAAGSIHHIAVASDRHADTKAISIAMGGMPDTVEYVCLNGDMVNYDESSGQAPGGPSERGGSPGGPARKQQAYSTSTILAEVKSVFPGLDASKVSIVYGSHDANATDDAGIMKTVDRSKLPSPTGSDTSEISQGRSGLIYTGYDGSKPAFYVYGVSYYDMMKPNEKGASLQAGGMKSAQAFKAFADEHPDVPLIVIGHVPIHGLRGDNLAASCWHHALNYAATGAENGTVIKRPVAYLHGHNHTVEETEYNLSPGAKLKVQGLSRNESADSVIYYTYITAGYLRDHHTATLVTVRDGALSFKKYKGCVVSFDTVGGNRIEDVSVQEGSTVKRPADPTRPGYEFCGWFHDAACEKAWDFSADTVTEDLTIHARWMKGTRPGTPGLTSTVTASKRKVVLKWAAVNGADDYRVASRKAGEISWKNAWSNGSRSYVMKGLRKQGFYEFKVRAAAESGDGYIYSGDSAVSRRYISVIKGLKIKRKKKARTMKLSWKKDKNATRYQVQYATAKNMKNAQIVDIKAAKRSCTIRNLKKGKKYYVRIRPVVDKDNVVYYGAYTLSKAVK